MCRRWAKSGMGSEVTGFPSRKSARPGHGGSDSGSQSRVAFSLHCFLQWPEFNAAEYRWQETRRKTAHHLLFLTVDHLKEKLFRWFNRFQGNPAALNMS
jgi:hypothetical protein